MLNYFGNQENNYEITKHLFEDEEIRRNFIEFFNNNEGVLFQHAVLICGNIACEFNFMINIFFEENLYEKIDYFLRENKDHFNELEFPCWLLNLIVKRPLKIYEQKVKLLK